jgi:hypothetical protein
MSIQNLTLQTKICDHRHTVCLNNMNYFKFNMNKLNSVDFRKFIESIFGSNTNYNNCLSNYSNKNSKELLDFIILCSSLIEITAHTLIHIAQFQITDDKLLLIIKNQLIKNPNYKKDSASYCN